MENTNLVIKKDTSAFFDLIFYYNISACLVLPIIYIFFHMSSLSSTNCPFSEKACFGILFLEIPLMFYFSGLFLSVPLGIILSISALIKKEIKLKKAYIMFVVSILLIVLKLTTSF